MVRWVLVVSIVLLSNVFAVQAGAIEATEAVLTTAVVDRKPVDNVEVFPVQGGRLYCFTRIIGATEPTSVVHLWYHGAKLVSRVELPVNSPDWRTWSAKSFQDSETGEWHVEVRDTLGQILRQLNFRLL